MNAGIAASVVLNGGGGTLTDLLVVSAIFAVIVIAILWELR